MPDRMLTQIRRFRSLIGATGSAVALLLLVALGVDAQGICPEPEKSSDGTAGSVTLDARHPVVEQSLTISIPPEALPVGLAPGSVTIVPRLSYPGRPDLPTSEASGPRSRTRTAIVDPAPPAPLTSAVQVHLLDRSTGRTIAHSGLPETRISPYDSDERPAIPLDCTMGQACERSYVLRLILSDAAGSPLDVAWIPTLRIQYTRAEAPCTPPQADVAIDAGEPTLVDDAAREDAKVASTLEHARLIARHVTISTARATADTTTARFSVLGTHDPDAGWNAWARLVPDTGGPPIVEGLLGEERRVPHLGFLEGPVLVDCPIGRSCSRGYWFVVQAIPGDPHQVYEGVSTNIGRFTWDLHVITIGSGAVPPGSLTAILDDETLDRRILARETMPGGTFEISQPDRDRILPLTITLPEAADTMALERRLAGHVIVTVQAETHNAAVSFHLRGPAAGGSNPSGSSGRSQTSMIAHPFDACPTDPCRIDVHARLSASSGAKEPRADVTWSATLVGFPQGTSISGGQVIDGPSPPVRLDPAHVVVALTLFAVWSLMLWHTRRLRRRIAAATPPSDEARRTDAP